ncbi:tail fiber assembly protein [Providencia rustigianii]|uniref:Caudovirales tail fiber assembly protein n=1 Tax=Providencia rustigianii DSM 4541 TaxID=500637 RepID=D1NYY2_9GAMM|nr:tail fiber assembly protein [Providencia rustigianii]EFB73680.1 caudovirales tail fiber assembly protein [Providencia rustigianii DSM 4541]SUC26989.1 Bacteriophage tail assembly protein [Providencia rustigianii]
MSLTKKFERYLPDTSHYSNIVYLKNIDGDWYQQQSMFSQNTVKILYDDEGIIASISNDISMLYPEGYYVLELDEKTIINPDFHRVKNGEIYVYQSPKERVVSENKTKKQTLLREISDAITPLQDAVELGIATDEEREQLRAWKEYRVQVNRVDVELGLDINWPVSPK